MYRTHDTGHDVAKYQEMWAAHITQVIQSVHILGVRG